MSTGAPANTTRHAAPASDAATTASCIPDVSIAALFRLAAPILIAQLAVIALGVIDTVMAGRLSARDLAAVAIGSSIYASVFVGMMGVLQALTPIAGRHFGAGRYDEVGLDLIHGLWLAAALSAVGAPLLLTNGQWLHWVDIEPAVRPIASTYLVALGLGLPAALATRAYVAIHAAVGRPTVTMTINIAALGAKIPLNLAFMYGSGPLPALGGAGCGVATAVLLWGILLANWLVWRLDPFYARFRLADAAPRAPVWRRQRELLRLGLPSGGSVLIEVTSFTFITLLLAPLGAVVVAGHQILVNLVSTLYMLPLSLGVAGSVLVSQALGAAAPSLARRAAVRCYWLAVGLALLLATALFFAREPFVAAFTTDASVAAVALGAIGLSALFHVFDAMQAAASFLLRGYKVALAPMLIHSMALWGLGLLGGYWLAFHTELGARLGGAASFWAAADVGLILAAGALSWILARVTRQHWAA
ncbi:MAG: MATE family efflux transporter [Sutterellaceae bacterium]|nr:MATE family efflux transporter [Burkholderiaceae bacterium]MCX7900842.1 MATE family efflux transporter [Burkholderiaceae bacterium]MDW8430820.1 MATE family efflux transporter [Sutterellaceae bacterium]